MATNYGIGFGAFMAGLERGMAAGERYNAYREQQDAKDTAKAATEDARKQREEAVASKTAALMGLGDGQQAMNYGGGQQSGILPGILPGGNAGNGAQGATSDMGGSVAGSAAPPVAGEAVAATPEAPPVVPQKTGAGVEGVVPAQPGTGAGVAALRVNNPAQAAPQQEMGAAPGVMAQESPNLSPRFAAVGLPTLANRSIMSKADAAKQAESTVPDVLTFFQKSGVPRVSQMYIAQGKPEMAAAWEKWSEDRTNQNNVKTWAKAYKAVELGDWDKAAEHITDLYSHYQDGQTVMGKPETVKDKDGQVTGFNVRVKDDASGQERAQFIPRDDLAKLGLVALSPPELFKMTQAKITADDDAKRKAALEVGKSRLRVAEAAAIDNAKAPNRLAEIDRRHENRLEEIYADLGAKTKDERNKVREAYETKRDLLVKAGVPAEEIDRMTPEMLGVKDTRKEASESDMRMRLMSDFTKSDPMFARKSADEKRAAVDEAMKIVRSGVSPTKLQASDDKKPSSSGNTPASTAAKVGAGQRYYLDTTTGKPVLR